MWISTREIEHPDYHLPSNLIFASYNSEEKRKKKSVRPQKDCEKHANAMKNSLENRFRKHGDFYCKGMLKDHLNEIMRSMESSNPILFQFEV